MLGVTNAQGVTGPYMAQELSGQSQNFLVSLDEIREQLTELQRKYGRMRNNPHLGAVVNYAGLDWITCHVDDGNGLCYLALKNIYEMTKFADSASGSAEWRGSLLESRLKRFDDILSIFSMGTYSNQGAHELELTTFSQSTLYAFLPTYQQITEDFDLFNGNRFGRRIAAYPGETVVTTFSSDRYQIHSAESMNLSYEFHPWWTCSVNDDGTVSCVSDTGRVLASPQNVRCGLRPFICMKMR